MAEVLSGPVAIAALVLAVAAAAKLRAPATAAGALTTLGLPGGRRLVRAGAGLEAAVAGWCLVWPGRWAALTLAAGYAAFAVAAHRLARRRAACGCFGAGDAPVSAAHWALSVAFTLVCVAGAVWPPPSLVTGAPLALLVGVAGAAYAAVVAYTALPAAWSAWEAR